MARSVFIAAALLFAAPHAHAEVAEQKGLRWVNPILRPWRRRTPMPVRPLPPAPPIARPTESPTPTPIPNSPTEPPVSPFVAPEPPEAPEPTVSPSATPSPTPSYLTKSRADGFANLAIGADNLWPRLSYEWRVASAIAFGVDAMLVDIRTGGRGERRGYSGLLTALIYPAKMFRGPWLKAGFGVTSLRATESGDVESFASSHAMAGAGYRFGFDSGFNFSVGVGLHYVPTQPRRLIQDSPKEIPSLLLDLGWNL